MITKLSMYRVKMVFIILLLAATFTELSSCQGQEVVPVTRSIN